VPDIIEDVNKNAISGLAMYFLQDDALEPSLSPKRHLKGVDAAKVLLEIILFYGVLHYRWKLKEISDKYDLFSTERFLLGTPFGQFSKPEIHCTENITAYHGDFINDQEFAAGQILITRYILSVILFSAEL